MTEARVFGPIRGAGTQLNEEVEQETLEQGLLGSTLLAGVFERGVEGDITILPGSRALTRRMGGLIDPAEHAVPSFTDLWNPLSAQHFWNRSRGAGTMIGMRVVPTKNDAGQDDRPDKSSILVWNRESVPKLLGQIDAHNGGSWGGKRKHFLGKISGTPGTDFPTANQVQLAGITTKDFKYDEYRNGYVALVGLPGISYKIVNIDPDGLITFEADQDVASDWGSGETAGVVTGSVAGPTWNLAPDDTLDIHVDEDGGDFETVTFAAVPATVEGGAGSYSLTIAHGFSIKFDADGDVQPVVYAAGHADIEAALADINAQIVGGRAINDGGGNIDFESDTFGTDSVVVLSVEVGTGLADIGHSIGTTTEATSDVADINAVTLAEIQARIVADIVTAPCTASMDAGNFLVITSDTVGAGSSIQIESSSVGAHTALGLDTDLHEGTDGPSDLNVYLTRTNQNRRGLIKAIDVEYRDGALRADTEFGMIVRINGKVTLNYRDLSMKTGVFNNWVDAINDDPNNDVITVTDSFTGDRDQVTARPSNHYGVSNALTATRLTIANPTMVNITVGDDWVPSLTWTSWGASAKVQRLTVTVLAGLTTALVSTDKGNQTWTITLGTPVDLGEHIGALTVDTASGTATEDDYFFIYMNPLEPDELVGGRVYPNRTDVQQKNQNFSIVGNDVSYIDVSALNDLTDAGNNVAGKDYRMQWPQQMAGGYDGYLAGMTTADYEALLDAATSPARKLKGRGYGLVKMAAPGTAYITQGLAVSQKMKTMVAALNWHAKVEMPWVFHDWDVYYEEDLIDWVNNDLQRGSNGDYVSTHFPSFAYIRDPFASAESDSRMVLVPAMGLILGNEAYVAKRYEGYHKAPAGKSVQIPQIVKLPVVGRPEDPVQLDEEKLNPAGINVIKWMSGGKKVVQWGDRTLSQNTVLRWLHKRYMLSQYGNDLQEGFDFTIFEINDPLADTDVVASLHDYFLPEWRKRAIRGNTFVGGEYPAAIFKMDSDNNTDVTRGDGDQIVEISLRLADTIERLRIFLGAMGVVEAGI